MQAPRRFRQSRPRRSRLQCGPGRIQKWLAKESELPRETRDYVRIITGTKAEDWIERSEALAIRIDLPREAPCEGVGSLSKSRDVTWVPVTLAPSTATIIRKAEQLAARLSANRARKRFVALPHTNGTAHGKARGMIAARAKGAKARIIRVAFLGLAQTGFSSSVTGDVTTRNTRSVRPEFEIACSTPGGRKITSCLRTTWFLPAISINPSPSSTW